jgi:hypothetical protein
LNPAISLLYISLPQADVAIREHQSSCLVSLQVHVTPSGGPSLVHPHHLPFLIFFSFCFLTPPLNTSPSPQSSSMPPA